MEIEVVITKSKKVIVNQRLIGPFDKVQDEIVENAMHIVDKHKVKAKYIGENKFRYIGDWEQIIREYYEFHGFKKQNGSEEGVGGEEGSDRGEHSRAGTHQEGEVVWGKRLP